MLTRLLCIAVAALLFVPTLGCTTLNDIENIQDQATDAVGPIEPSNVVGQTFLSNHSGLNGVQILAVVYDGPPMDADATLTFHLRSKVDSDSDVATSTVKIAELKHNVPCRFQFPPVSDSKDKPFYFFFDTSEGDGNSRISVWSSKLDTYPFGYRYVNGQETGGDLTFRTFYDYDSLAIISDLTTGMRDYAALIIPLIVILIAPGYVLLSLHPRKREHDPVETIALSSGLSIAIVGLGILYAKLASLELDSSSVRIVAVLISIIAVLLFVRDARSRPEWRRPSKETVLFSLTILFVLIATFAIRFLHIKDLVVPMWVDSVQHAEIIQLIVSSGGLPDSYRPFAEVEPFSYHFGFHALVALFHWLSGIDIPKSMLIIGQVLNGLMALSTYLLANKLFKNKLAGLCSATVVGLISVMPAYYVSWGRYTQLTGMVLLPVVLVLTIELLNAEKVRPNLRLLSLAAISIGGLIIAHPRVTVFYLCFLIAYVSVEIMSAKSKGRDSLCTILGISIVGFSGVLIALPWVWNNLNPFVFRIWEGASQTPAADNPFPMQYVTALNDKALIAIAAGGLALGILKRQKAVLLIGLWTGLMLFSANIYLVGLPGSTMISNGALVIALFLPIALLNGYLFGGVAENIEFTRWRMKLRTLAAAGLVLVGLYGAQGLLGIVNPATAFFVKEDSQALTWITQNTPKDAKFLINSYNWQFGIYAGTDGGYWIPALTGREASLPSVLYALGGPGSHASINSTAQASNSPMPDDEMMSLLKTNGISHIYVGYRGGALYPEMFLNKPGYKTLYSQDGVWVFEVVKD